ncbi:FAD:protein FMN transferase [Streptosporangium sp. NPDC087985]|uniref:FAD:protein FMN transferase n=1 Tax=Streptosporangium sp. NPDC087985 TaxID=3366196 RepID=UPI0037FE35C9
MRHVEHAMGTVFSFDIRRPHDLGVRHLSGDVGQALGEAVAWLHRVDEIFSTYRPDSPVSRLGKGEIGLADCPPEVADVLALCDTAAELSHGYFTAYPGGRLDPSAMVKGWAIERASLILSRSGAVDHCVNGGGDIQLAGTAAPGRPWRVGIAHPLRPDALATVVAGCDLAVATSGTAERGAHILDPHTGRPATELASITLVGGSLTMTDAYATAAFAMGDAARTWVERLDGMEAFAVTASGETWRTPGFPAA